MVIKIGLHWTFRGNLFNKTTPCNYFTLISILLANLSSLSLQNIWFLHDGYIWILLILFHNSSFCSWNFNLFWRSLGLKHFDWKWIFVHLLENWSVFCRFYSIFHSNVSEFFWNWSEKMLLIFFLWNPNQNYN